MITAGPVTDPSELAQILALQRANLVRELTPEQIASQGFVTVEHTLAILERMQALAPQIVARATGDTGLANSVRSTGQRAGELAGYALVMPVECRTFIPILEPMFARLDELGTRDYYVMGQVCVAEAQRGRGVFDALYAAHRRELESRYARCVTEVATRNTRSMRAHGRVGFRIIERYRDATDEWALMAWDWRAT